MRLCSSRLKVDLAAPTTAYRGSRFDWTGFVTQVRLDDRTTFCVPEAVDGTGTGGDGLCNEFGIMEPVGFADAQPGDWFPKLGIGLLRRPDSQPYQFARAYDIRPFPMSWQATETAATFQVEPLPTRGYAVRLAKTFTVADNQLTIDYCCTNVGSRSIRTREYCHNFLMMDAGVAQGYVLRTPFSLEAWRWPDALRASGPEVRWLTPPEQAVYVPMEPVPAGARTFELAHDSGAVVRTSVNADLARLTVWGTGRVISAEAFVAVDIEPGATQQWQRVYAFERLKAER